MPSPRRITAISLLVSGLLLLATIVFAGQAATVTHLSGPVAAHKADGSMKAISVGSKIDEGDTLVTEKRTYARLKFNDGSEITLKPNSRFKVEKYSYDHGKPKDDFAFFKLIKGGLRTITGMIGKRGNHDSYKMDMPTATLGIRGTIYDAQFCQGDSCGAIKPGLYLAVTSGIVVITNNAGTQTTLQVKAGQYVYVQSPSTPPVVLPTKPNIPFNPPPSLGGGAVGSQHSAGGSSGSSDCQVR
ncbi:MAG: hypothetical protein CSYNP_02386 [Syntrophus sp. SKADARSKE-3]|nr:hypothetical protein [Syntrophus sp. SKADARSKE-3]